MHIDLQQTHAPARMRIGSLEKCMVQAWQLIDTTPNICAEGTALLCRTARQLMHRASVCERCSCFPFLFVVFRGRSLCSKKSMCV